MPLPLSRADRRSIIGGRAIETLFVVFAIVITTNAFYPLFGAAPLTGTAEVTTATSAASNPLHVGLRFLLWIWAGVIMVRSTLRDGLRWPFIWAMPMVLLVLASSLWSVSFGWSFYFGLMFAANVVVAHALALIVRPDRFADVLTVVLGALVVASFVFLLVRPDLAMSARWAGGWIAGIQLAGIFSHKTTAGVYFAAFLIMLWLTDVVTGPARLVATAVVLLALVLSNSATGLAGGVLITVLFVAARAWGIALRPFAPLVGLVTFLFACLVPFVQLGDATELVGRDAGLTGRTWIWAAAAEFFAERPLLGYGYAGFFHPGDYSPVWRLWSMDQYFHTPHFHNTTIDVAISMGLVGVVVYAFVLLSAFGIAGNTSIPLEARRALTGVFALMVLSTAFDFTIMAHNTFGTTLMFYCFFASRLDYDRAGRS